MNILHFPFYSIVEQLKLEERLLRSDTQNWCLINEGSPPAIVMGISGKQNLLVDPIQTSLHNIPILRRFSGGGTVIVDENTLFVTFICQKELHPFPAYPEPILRWTEGLYKEIFQHPTFHLKENDYVFGEHKCGGNAQYIRKHRWLHHTSFLWDYQPERMRCLLHPPKTPTYRANRPHENFLCRLRDFYPSKNLLIDRLKKRLFTLYNAQEVDLRDCHSL